MTVIFISFEFPPINSAGVYRPLRFMNALAAQGHKAIVVTFENDENLQKVQSFFDQKLLNNVHPDVEVVRVPIDDISQLTSHFFGRLKYIVNNPAGDNFYNGCKSRIFDVVQKLIECYSPQAFITSCPPFSSAILCRDLSRKFNLPFILDMRDAWSGWAMAPQATYFHYVRKKLVERSVFKSAALITTVTPQLLNKFRSSHPQIPASKFRLIYNSPNYAIKEQFEVQLKPLSGSAVFNIGYTGSFYFSNAYKKKKRNGFFEYYPGNENWVYRTPYYFFQSLKRLFEIKPEWKSQIFFHYVGAQEKLINELKAKFDISDNVILHGYQPEEKVRELERSFDLLLATSEKVENDEHYCLPSKLFTYLLAKKPIIGFTTRGVQSDFIMQSGIGQVFNPDETEKNAQRMISLFQNGWEGKLNLDYFSQFDSKLTNQKFIDLVGSVVKDSKPAYKRETQTS